MELVQSRIVTDDVAGLAAFYARLVDTSVVLNDYYVEVPTGGMSRRVTKTWAGSRFPYGNMAAQWNA